MDLPVIEPLDQAHFLSIDKTLAYIGRKIIFLEELMINLPGVKEGKMINTRLVKVNYKDKG